MRYVLLHNDSNVAKECTKGELVWADLHQTVAVDRRSPYHSMFKSALKIDPTATPVGYIIAGVYTETIVIPAKSCMSVAVAVADYCEWNCIQATTMEEGKHYIMARSGIPMLLRACTNWDNTSHLFVFTVIHNDLRRPTICIHH